LDTSVIVPWLKETYGCEVVCFTADVGQRENFDEIRQKALASGASQAIVRDLRDEFANEYLLPLVQSGAIYEHKYLLGSAISRPLIAKHQIEIAAMEGADAVAHGATGKGNDQVRLELSYMALNPRLKVIAPWREWEFDGREDLLKYAKKKNVPVSQSARNIYTRDENLWHVVHEGGPLEDIDRGEPDEKMFLFSSSPEKAPDKPEYVEIDFVSGLPKRLNGKGMSGAELIAHLNEIGARNGVGRMDLVENRLIGMKSHEVDEVPGGTILRHAHMALEEITLDRETYHFKQAVSLKMADLIYNGQWFTPLRDALKAFVAVTQRDVTGSVKLKVYKGNVVPVERKAVYSLYREDVATFNRDDVYNHADAGGFIRLYGLPLRIKAQVDLNRAAFAPPIISSPGGKRD
jgi:argininosuccinate synthase